MRVLVTGASGTIGRALCDALFARGDEVAGLSRNPGAARQANPRLTWHKWEPTLERPDPAAFEGVDGVVHLLGERIDQRWTDEAKQRIMESRRTGTHNLVGTLESLPNPPKVLVSQSAVGYYGDRGADELDEGDGPDRASTPRWSRPGRPPRASSTARACASSSPAPARC